MVVKYSSRLTRIASQRRPSAIRKLMPLLEIPDMISLGGGLPNAKMFPFESLSFTVASKEISLSSSQLDTALQYSASPGIPSLLQWLLALQSQEHNIGFGSSEALSRSVCISGGSQDVLCKAFEMLVEPYHSVLVDDPCYSGALAFLKPYGCNIVGVQCDKDGIRPDSLQAIMSSWNRKEPKPGVLYTVPTAQNPSGATLTRQRRRDLYEVAELNDLIVLEDDPYWFLHTDRKSLPSLLSLDRSGRVLRFDSFSKVLSSGIRIGFATGPSPLIECMNLHTQATNLHTSGVSQALVAALFDQWKLEGFEEHLERVCAFYNSQCDALCRSAEGHLSGLATWERPSAGMFLWLRLNGVNDSTALLERAATEAKILLLPGQVFSPDERGSAFVRASFSTASPEQMETAMERLAHLLRHHQSTTPA